MVSAISRAISSVEAVWACAEFASDNILARIVGLFRPPFLHQRFELRLAVLGQHDADRGEEVAVAFLGGKALALEPEGAAAQVQGGMVISTGLSSVGTRTLAPSAAS